MTKKTKKPAFKPVFTVDLTEWCDAEELKQKFIEAKLEANISLTSDEVLKLLEAKIEDAIYDFVEDMFDGHNCVVINEDGELLALDAVKAEPKRPWWKKLFGIK